MRVSGQFILFFNMFFFYLTIFQPLRLRKTNPAHFVAIFNKQKKRAKELSQFAYASLEASSLLTRQ